MLRPDEIAPQTFRLLRRREYDRLVELGVFTRKDRIELLRGWLVTVSPQEAPHAATTHRVVESVSDAIGKRAMVRCQLPFAATEDSEPEPDVAVVPRGSYDDRHPSRAHLIVEVSWDSTRKDLGVKPGVYGEAGVPEYWVVNLPADAIDVFTDPSASGYDVKRRVRRGDRIRLVAFPDVEVAVDDILPARPAPSPRSRKRKR